MSAGKQISTRYGSELQELAGGFGPHLGYWLFTVDPCGAHLLTARKQQKRSDVQQTASV